MPKNNKKIRNATECKSGNLTFKSQLEKSIYKTLLEQGFNPQYEPKTHELWSGFIPITPFYDKESDAQQTKRINNGGTTKSKILTLKTGKIVGVESLIRWDNPKYKNESPEKFITLAEKNGMIIELGTLIINKVFKYAKTIQDSGISIFSIPFKYLPVKLLGLFITSSGVPSATTYPPCSPAPGPISIR